MMSAAALLSENPEPTDEDPRVDALLAARAGPGGGPPDDTVSNPPHHDLTFGVTNGNTNTNTRWINGYGEAVIL